MRRTKIIATLGPATDDPDVLSRLLAAGVDAVRLNFSHGTAHDHAERVQHVRSIAAEQKRAVCIIADLQGPKIRIACFKKVRSLSKKTIYLHLMPRSMITPAMNTLLALPIKTCLMMLLLVIRYW